MRTKKKGTYKKPQPPRMMGDMAIGLNMGVMWPYPPSRRGIPLRRKFYEQQ
jgi:hypothetical protein